MHDDLAALVGSRICHDLISPIGAVGNGLELLSISGGDTSDEMALITDSIASANARLRFLRICFGPGARDQAIGRSEIMQTLKDACVEGRVTYAWQIEGDQNRAFVRIAFLLIQCIESALPVGGDITVSTNGVVWKVQGIGKRVKVVQDHWETLAGQDVASDIMPAHVQFALLPELLQKNARTVETAFTETTVTVMF